MPEGFELRDPLFLLVGLLAACAVLLLLFWPTSSAGLKAVSVPLPADAIPCKSMRVNRGYVFCIVDTEVLRGKPKAVLEARRASTVEAIQASGYRGVTFQRDNGMAWSATWSARSKP